ncbi:MAG TPA: phosphatase PAP2 family protein [Miltoncostaeaceae bacterium]|jgi:membrane-associated phospholipid phosphatase|nr:phosphatase PAP2 family protein [Miltoncostaeaceae bacterium]
MARRVQGTAGLPQALLASSRADLARLGAAARSARRAAASVGSGWREGLIAAVAYGLYSLVKGIWGGSLEEGRRAAASLIDLEKSLGIYVEPDLQRFFVDHHLGMPFWNAFYVVSQVVVLPLTLFLVYRYARGSYAFVRNMAVISWTAGVIWYALQPVAPPRLLASGFTDTVSTQTFFELDSEFIRAFYNPVAAMPSLHVGMAPVVAWALIRLTPWLWTKVLGVAYPFLVAVSIVVTGNHFILDIVGGLAVVLPAAAISAWLVREPRPGPSRAAAALRAVNPGGRSSASRDRGPAPRT